MATPREGEGRKVLAVLDEAARDLLSPPTFFGSGPVRRRRRRKMPEVAERFPDGCFNGPAVPLDPAYQHRALHRRDTEIRQGVLIGAGQNRAPGFLLDEKGSQLVLDHFKDEAEVLTDQLVILGDLIADGAERTAARHSEVLLQFHVRSEPPLQIFPGLDLVLKGSRARPDGVQVGLQHLVNETFLVLEIVIELALAGIRRLDDLIGTGGADPLFVKQIGGGLDDAKPRIGALRGSYRHKLTSLLCTNKYNCTAGQSLVQEPEQNPACT